MNCPHCNSHRLEEVAEEVDIGVGVQRHVTGWECLECGSAIAACPHCGRPEGEGHAAWCADALGN